MRITGLLAAPFLLVAPLLASCVTPAAPIYVPPIVGGRQLVTSDTTVFDRNYQVGQRTRANVGDEVISVREFLVHNELVATFTVTSNFSMSDGVTTLQFATGDALEATRSHTEKDGETFLIARRGDVGIFIRTDGTVWNRGLRYPANGPSTMFAAPFSITGTPSFTREEAMREYEREPASTNFDIVYTGNDGNAMRFTYREYTADNMARPAFFQELSYPIGSREVRFRNILITVFSIDAGGLTYLVASDGM